MSGSEKKQGIFLTLCGGCLWGLSGACGQFLFREKGACSDWLVPIRLMTAGFSLLFAIRERRLGILIKGALSCVPGGVYVLLYIALTHGLIVF